MRSDHDTRRDDLAAYLLGALDEREANAVERHLADCPQCTEYLEWLDPVAATLAGSVQQLEPPARLKRSIMSAAKDDLKATRKAERSEARRAGGFWAAFWHPMTAAALSVVLVAGVVGGVFISGGDEESMTTELTTSDPGVSAFMSAKLERDGDTGTIHVETLPPLPDGRVYQAWIERDGALRPSTPFVVKHDGGIEVALEGSLEGATAVKITREPEPGSQIPTSKVIMEASLS